MLLLLCQQEFLVEQMPIWLIVLSLQKIKAVM